MGAQATASGPLRENSFISLAHSMRAARILAIFHEKVHADGPEE